MAILSNITHFTLYLVLFSREILKSRMRNTHDAS